MSLRFIHRSSVTDSSLQKSGVDDSFEPETQSFPSYRRRRQLLLELVLKQMSNASSIESPILPPKCSQTNQQNSTEDPSNNQSSCNTVEFQKAHGDTPVETEEASNKEDNEESLDLEWTASFDSQNSLSDYRTNYLKAVSSLLGDFEIHPRTSQVFMPKKEDVINCTSAFSAPKLEIPSSSARANPKPARPRMQWTVASQNSPHQRNSTQTIYKTGTPSGGDGTGVVAKAKAVLSKIVSSVVLSPLYCRCNYCCSFQRYFTIVALVVILLLGIFVCAQSKNNTFKLVDQMEWSWSVFMKEPLFKGFIYSTKRNFIADDYDWS